MNKTVEFSPKKRNRQDEEHRVIKSVFLRLLEHLKINIRASQKPAAEKEKLIFDMNRMSVLMMNLYSRDPEKYTCSALRARTRAAEYGFKKRQHEMELYKSDANYREYKKWKMKEWRRRPGNAEREKATAIKKRNTPPQTKYEF